jgi:pimeloyl-ACP methyl ester carboxylesterase
MVHFVRTAIAPAISLGEVTLANGVRLQYRRQGPEIGPALILLHGYSDSSLSFGRIMPLLPSEQRVIAVDLRGHGDSDKPADGYRMSDLADDVIGMMDRLHVASAIVVGHSMGSFVAQALVERAPRRVSGLVLVGSAASAVNDVVTVLQLAVESLTDPIDAEFVRGFQFATVAQPVPEAFMDAAIVNSRRMPAAVWKKVLTGLVQFQPKLPRSSVRALVLGGTRDSVFSVGEQVTLARQYPFAQLRLIENVGHSLHWEQPEVFVRELMRFMK